MEYESEAVLTPCWILCHPRTGSSLLCDLLNATGKFPPYTHPFLQPDRRFLKSGQSFNEWLRLFVEKPADFWFNPPPHLKCLHEFFHPVLAGVPRTAIEAAIPGLKFVLLERTDRIAQATSSYIATTMKQWHLVNEAEDDKYRSSPCPFDLTRALEAHDKVIKFYDWREFLSDAPYHHIEYQSLLDNPAEVLSDLLLYLNVPTDTVSRAVAAKRSYIRMTRPESDKYARLIRGFVKGKLWL